MIYLDPTAIMKLITTTPESPALADYLRSRTDTTWFTCALSRADVMRTVATLHPDAAALSAGPRLHTLITYNPELTRDAAAHHITTTSPGGSP